MDMVMLHLTPNPNPTQSLTVNPLPIFFKRLYIQHFIQLNEKNLQQTILNQPPNLLYSNKLAWTSYQLRCQKVSLQPLTR